MTVVNVTPPVISGNTIVGNTLVTSNGQWTSTDPLVYTYQWERCDSAGANCVDIGGATHQSYLLVSADLGSRLRVKVTATETAPSGLLRWTPPGYPTYSGYQARTISNSSRFHQVAFGSNIDAVFTISEVITDSVSIVGFRNVVIIGGEFNFPTNVQKSRYIGIYGCTGTVHIEGIKADKASVAVDAGVGLSTGAGPATPGAIIQLENCRFLSMPNIGATHDDCVQNWNKDAILPNGYNGGARAYHIDHCTFLAGYQATFFGNHAGPIGNSSSYISSTNYLATVTAANQVIYFWKTWRVDPWGYSSTFYFDEVYLEGFLENKSVIPNKNGGGTTVPGADSPTRGYTDGTDGNGNFLTWLATSDCQGTIRKNSPPGGDFCPSGTPGMTYTSPGYA